VSAVAISMEVQIFRPFIVSMILVFLSLSILFSCFPLIIHQVTAQLYHFMSRNRKNFEPQNEKVTLSLFKVILRERISSIIDLFAEFGQNQT
jgi:hypothetical protein